MKKIISILVLLCAVSVSLFSEEKIMRYTDNGVAPAAKQNDIIVYIFGVEDEWQANLLYKSIAALDKAKIDNCVSTTVIVRSPGHSEERAESYIFCNYSKKVYKPGKGSFDYYNKILNET